MTGREAARLPGTLRQTVELRQRGVEATGVMWRAGAVFSWQITILKGTWVKSLLFLGTAHEDLKAFPNEARRAAGQQLKRVQGGLMPFDWKPMSVIGPGVVEIRIRVSAGAFRVMYVASIAEHVLVLHCFQKKSARTSQGDISVAKTRFKEFLRRNRP